MRLNTLQQQMKQAIVAGAEPPALGGNTHGLGVYRYAWRARMIATLRDNYPVLHRVLGDDGFEAVTDAYLAAHPSSFRSIRWFGDRLPEFLRARSETLPHPAIPDLARMEWAICLAFDGPDAAALTADALAALSAEEWPYLRFALHPTLVVLDLEWAVAPVWRELSEAEDPNQPVSPPEPLVHSIRIWRHGLQPTWHSVAPLEAALLRAIAAGEHFGALCAITADAVGEEAAAATVLGYVHQWLNDGLLVVESGCAAAGDS